MTHKQVKEVIIDEEKQTLLPAQDLSTDYNVDVHPVSRPTLRSCFLVIGLGLSILVLATVMYVVEVHVFLNHRRCSSPHRVHSAESLDASNSLVKLGSNAKWRRAFDSNDTTTSSAPPHFSYTTDPEGTTETYVFTTRPIVNPGGFTIGTLTGYVEYTGTPFVQSTSTTTTTTTSPRHHHNASTIPSSTRRSRHTLTLTSRDHHSSPTPTAPSRPRFGKRNFADGSAQIEFEVEPEATPSTTREYSYSVNREGETLTYVKTNRAIVSFSCASNLYGLYAGSVADVKLELVYKVNPAGFTIGHLTNAFVKLEPTPLVNSKEPRHEELKRRSAAEEIIAETRLSD